MALAGVLLGAADLSPTAVLVELADRIPGVQVDSGLDEVARNILWELRLPRVVLGALVGACLATSGAAYQGVFRNPLADPWLLGAAAGAGLAATAVVASGGSGALAGIGVPAAAFVGALGGVAMAWFVGRSTGGRGTAALILGGVAVSAFLTAGQTWLLQRNAETIREVYGWILGRLSTSGWSDVGMLAIPTVLSLSVILFHRRILDVLSVGEAEAATLGVDAVRSRVVVVVAASLATAGAVAASGLIGFVGIVVPHTVRLMFGGSYRAVLPLSMLFGAAFMVGTDLVARTVVAPAELPIGVITAFVGAPFFAFVLRRGRGSVGA
ncbi:iron ABC transporter permease [Nitriliruptoria bacterium AS10]|nr:iron ABC transporter permease [Salsipaludibacter albus]MBY5163743.1 iron ABC transporter permease [Salsipaludibacter albus]